MQTLAKHPRTVLLIVTILAAAVTVATAAARGGSLDPSFGNGGTVTTDFTGKYNSAHAVMIDANRRIVVAGVHSAKPDDNSLAVARYSPDGSLDKTFGDKGHVLLHVGEEGAFPDQSIEALAEDSSGRIVAAGYAGWRDGDTDSYSALVLVRFLPDGSPDPSFGHGGSKLIYIAGQSTDILRDVAIDDAGRIIAVGSTGDPITLSYRMVVVRLTAAGKLDDSFSGNGVAYPIGARSATVDSSGQTLGLAPNGKISVAGSSSKSSSYRSKMAVARLRPNGELDRSFGQDGRQFFFGGEVGAAAYDLAVDRRGRTVLAGCTRRGGNFYEPDNGENFTVVRLSAKGRGDQSFGKDGVSSLRVGGPNAEACAVSVVLQGSRVVAGGYSLPSGEAPRFSLVQLSSGGKAVEGFGRNGRVTTQIGNYSKINAIADDGGEIIAAGYTDDSESNGSDVALAKYEGE